MSFGWARGSGGNEARRAGRAAPWAFSARFPSPHRLTLRPRLPARSSRPRPLWGARAAAALSLSLPAGSAAMAAQGEPQVQFKVRVRLDLGPRGANERGGREGTAWREGSPGTAHAAALSLNLARPGGRRRHREDNLREAPLDGRV